MQKVKTCLSIFNEILKSFDNGLSTLELEENLYKTYNTMGNKEKRETINIVLSVANEDNNLKTFLLTYLLKVLSDEMIIQALYCVLKDGQVQPEYVICLLHHIGAYEFINNIAVNEVEEYKINREIYHNNIIKIKNRLECANEYIALDRRNEKKIVIVCRQLLNELHAPTLIIVNMCKWLEKLGYEMYIVINYMGEMQAELSDVCYGTLIDNNISKNTDLINYEISDINLKVYNLVFHKDNFYTLAQQSVELIRKLNPKFIISVGGDNLIADLVNKVTTVCSMSCTSNPVITGSNIHINAFMRNELDTYGKYFDDKEAVFNVPIVYEKNEKINKKNKEEYGISKDTFVILIVGNRLDSEISDEFLSIMDNIYEKNRKIQYVFIGECSLLEKKIKCGEYKFNYLFIGYVTDLVNVMSIGDLYMNPPRMGGGTSATMALRNEIPIITLENCDVALRGKEFTCKSVSEYIYLVDKYIHDDMFMKKQRECCIESYKRMNSINSIESVEKFCKDICIFIKESEING